MKKHIWKQYRKNGKKAGPDYCESCGLDRTAVTEKAACKATRLW